MKIITISGSLRKDSYNKSLVRSAQKLAPKELEIEVFDISVIPFFNQDDEKDPPQAVSDLREKLSKADGLLVATPEYNNMVPGVLKNTFEWISRGDEAQELPLAIMGASSGGFGTVRAQNQLHLLGGIMGMRTHGRLKLPVSNTQDLIDEQGEINDEQTKEKIVTLLEKFAEFIEN